MINLLSKLGKGTNLGFLIGAISILPFAVYAGFGLAGYCGSSFSGIPGVAFRIVILVCVAGSIMLAVALVGALAGFILEWLIRKMM